MSTEEPIAEVIRQIESAVLVGKFIEIRTRDGELWKRGMRMWQANQDGWTITFAGYDDGRLEGSATKGNVIVAMNSKLCTLVARRLIEAKLRSTVRVSDDDEEEE